MASEETGDSSVFKSAAKAVAAFVALRRAATGATAGIDSDLRSLMAKGPRHGNGTGLQVGLEQDTTLVDVTDLQSYLRSYLAERRVGVSDEHPWIARLASQPLAAHSRPLCRFLLLTAQHNARPDDAVPPLLTKERPSREREMLSYACWKSNEFQTVEHIAPQSYSGTGWEESVYAEPYIKDSLGNLVLLPQAENTDVSNKSWSQKKLYYAAFAAQTREELEHRIEQAQREGFRFNRETVERLRSGRHYPTVEAVVRSPRWDAATIRRRTENLGRLAWQELAPWLGWHD